MKILRGLMENPALCSVVVAGIGAVVSIAIALFSCFWTLHVAKVTQNVESNRLMWFHKLEVYENAIEEINYLVPLYRRLWSDSYEKRSSSEVKAELPSLRRTINMIIEYQKEHIHEMELIDELEKYQQCAELLKKEIENLESFRR